MSSDTDALDDEFALANAFDDPDRGPRVRDYDFRRPSKLSRDHVRTLQIAYETFARQYSTALTSALRVGAQATLVAIDQLTYDEYVGSLPYPTVMAITTMEPLPGLGILEFSLSAALASVDHLLGGPGGTQPRRPLTDIETVLVRDVVRRVLTELEYALATLAPVKPRLEKLETNPQFAQCAAASETVVVASFDLRIGKESCVSTLCIPFTMLFPLLEAAAGTAERDRVERRTAQVAVRERLQDVSVEAEVRFAPVSLRTSEILSLSPGDVITLEHALSTPLYVTSSGMTLARAVPGSHGRRLACLVVEPPEEETR